MRADWQRVGGSQSRETFRRGRGGGAGNWVSNEAGGLSAGRVGRCGSGDWTEDGSEHAQIGCKRVGSAANSRRMNFLPVITRELQVQARQPVTHRMRWLAAGVGMAVWVVLMLIGGRATPQQRAQLIFMVSSLGCLGFVMLAGVFQTADCLSEERREGTLGLLFLTDLKGFDVVLGKLGSTSLQSFYTFLAVVPVLALPFLMGGTTGGEFWRVTLLLVVTLYLSLGLGMMVSALSRDARMAMGGTLVGWLGLAGGLPGIWWLATSGKVGGDLDCLLWGCPPYAFGQALDDGYTTGPGAEMFWGSIGTALVLGTASLLGASWWLPRRWQETKGGYTPKAAARWWSPGRLGSPRVAARRQQLRGEQPLYWLTTRDSRPRRMAAWAFLLLLPVWVYGLLNFGSGNRATREMAFVTVIAVTYGLHLIVKCLVAAEASRLLNADRQSGALELLLVAPLTVQSLAAAQMRGIWRAFRRWAVILTFMNLAVIYFTVQANLFPGNDEITVFVLLAMAGGALMLFLDGCALVNVGMWMALIKSRQAPAFLATLRRVLLPPWLLGALFFIIGVRGASFSAVGGTMIVWFILSFLVNVCVALPALQHFRQHFREVAALGHRESQFPTPAPAQATPMNR